MDFSAFAAVPIIDSHVHFIHPERMDEILALMDSVSCSRANLVCIPNRDATTHNPAALYFKEHYPERVYISGALDYLPLLPDFSSDPSVLAEQVRVLKQRGFDGLKLIEGKPEVRKLLPYPLDGPVFACMWAALEQEQFPVVFHVADPDEFWDPERCPDWARESGWDYSDSGCPSKEILYAEVDQVLQRHPDLIIIFAHFYFLSGDLERAGRFLDNHPNVCFDLAPHLGMYQDFSKRPHEVRDFFVRFQDRILYGTDMDTRVLVSRSNGGRWVQSISWLIRSFLEKEGEFTATDGTNYQGISLPQDVLEKIYHGNFERIYGPIPAALK